MNATPATDEASLAEDPAAAFADFLQTVESEAACRGDRMIWRGDVSSVERLWRAVGTASGLLPSAWAAWPWQPCSSLP